MNDKEKKAIEKIEKQILIGECEKAIGVPIYISDLKIVLNLIENQKAEIEKKDKQIDLMAIYLADIDFDECCAEIPEPCLGCSWEDYEPHTNCIKQYFEKKAEEEK